jgi:hypothetical protein
MQSYEKFQLLVRVISMSILALGLFTMYWVLTAIRNGTRALASGTSCNHKGSLGCQYQGQK